MTTTRYLITTTTDPATGAADNSKPIIERVRADAPDPTLTHSGAALLNSVGSFSVDAVEGACLRTAATLRRRGIEPGDRVVLKARNSVDYVITLLALLHLDVSVALLDDGLTVFECRRAVATARARWLLGDRHIALDAGVTVVTLDEVKAEEVFDEGTSDELSLDAWFAREDAMITWSSGSTGEPKAVVRSGPSMRAILDATHERMGYRTDDVLLPLVPFSHFYGLTTVLLWWTQACSLIISANGRLDQALRLGAEAGVTVLDATPASYHTIANLLERRPDLLDELSTIRMWCVGGAPLARPLAESFAALVGRPLLDGYGSTEAGNVAMASAENPTGCGRPVTGVDVEIRGENGEDVAVGDIGEIRVRSAGLMTGYLDASGELVRREGGTWFVTGDLGRFEADGSLVVLGRMNAVHRLGHTLYPEVIERKAEACGRPVKVIPIDDERRGSLLVFVVADPGGGQPRNWRKALNGVLPTYEQPNRVIVVPEFPLTNNGKPDRVALEQRARAAVPLVVARPAELLAAVAPDEALPDDAPGLPFDDRRHALRRVIRFLREHGDQVSEILTEVSNYKAVAMEIEAAIHTLDGAEEEVRRYRPDAVGQLTVFMSSNVLLYSYVLHMLVPSLYAEKIVFRPSGQVGRQSRMLHALLAPIHGLPIELAPLSQRKFVKGPVADADVIVFTGTYSNAEEVRTHLREDQLFIFFGQGINPFVVAQGANLENAVHDAVRIRLLNSGQDCFAPDIYLVHESERQRFTDLLTTRLKTLAYGQNTDPDADYGPLAYESAFRMATDYLTRSGELIVHGGVIDFFSWHVPPTVVTREAGSDPTIAELFSPIFNVVGYTDRDELKQILASPYFMDRAMGAMVYGEDPEIVEQLARKHVVAENATLLDIENGNRPFGGRGIMANYCSHHKKRVAEPLLVSKAVADYWGGTA